MAILKKVPVVLALSRGGKKYSWTAGKESAKFLKALGYQYYLIAPRTSGPTLCTLVPVDRKVKGAVTLQVKTTGQVHMEFLVEKTEREAVGVVSKGADTELWVFSGGNIQVRRPNAKALLRAQESVMTKKKSTLKKSTVGAQLSMPV